MSDVTRLPVDRKNASQEAHQATFEAISALNGLSSLLAAAGDGPLDMLQGGDLYMLLQPISDKLSMVEQYLAQPQR